MVNMLLEIVPHFGEVVHASFSFKADHLSILLALVKVQDGFSFFLVDLKALLNNVFLIVITDHQLNGFTIIAMALFFIR